MLNIAATDMDIAESNPLRYRGYYYDNETGYYYLQSRYYDPELGRFISADGFEYLDTSNRLNSNAYIYCWNCPTAFEDAEGTTPKLSADKQTIFDFLSNISSRIRERISARFQNLQSDFNASVEMLKFYYMNPGELTSDILSGLFGKEVHIEFKLLKEIRSKFVSFLQNVNELLKNLSDKSSNEEEGIAPHYIINDEPTNNWFEASLKGLILSIELDSVSRFFEELLQAIFPKFSFNNWYNDLFDSAKGYFEELFLSGVVAINTIYSYILDKLGEEIFKSGVDWSISGLVEKLLSEQISMMIDVVKFFISGINNFNSGYCIEYSFLATFSDFISVIVAIICPPLALAIGLADDLIKKIFMNIDSGNIWGKVD